MKIKWLGHAAFLITSDSGTKIITDPYITNESIKYTEIKESADIVTTSHEHFDHNNTAAVQGNPEIISGAVNGKVKGIEFKSVATYHDDTGGKSKGGNNMYCFVVDGIRICHAGDLGHDLSDKQAAQMGKVDVLIVPVGGFYTIDAKTATRVAEKLAPKVIIPMHYKTNTLDFPITGVDEFLKGKNNVTILDTCEIELKKEELPKSTRIMVLQPAP
jgi:L-ascorbate metabolism protein UlaG (beta-lactamase superfamily)